MRHLLYRFANWMSDTFGDRKDLCALVSLGGWAFKVREYAEYCEKEDSLKHRGYTLVKEKEKKA